MGAKNASPDLDVARLAARQHGVVSRSQLDGLGVGRTAFENRVERKQRRSIRIHRCASLASSQVTGHENGRPPPSTLEARATLLTVRHRIPVTTVARTIHDLETTAAPRLVRRAVRQAQLAGHALDPRTKADRIRSDLESDFLEFCRCHRLPPPEVNVRLGRWTVDFLWSAERLVVETDFHATHRGSVSFEDDHQRDLELRRLATPSAATPEPNSAATQPR